MSFGENYIYAEAIVAAALYAREKYKGTGTPDFFCTPHLGRKRMLLARDMNGRRIYNSKPNPAAALNVGNLYTAEQFEGQVRIDDETHTSISCWASLSTWPTIPLVPPRAVRLPGLISSTSTSTSRSILIETRISGALTRVYSAIALEEPVDSRRPRRRR